MPEQGLSADERAMKGAAMSPEERKRMWLEISPNLTEAEFDAYQDWRRERQSRAPGPGSVAPDFRLDELGEDRRRTGRSLRLGDLRGTPVALTFGSYT